MDLYESDDYTEVDTLDRKIMLLLTIVVVIVALLFHAYDSTKTALFIIKGYALFLIFFIVAKFFSRRI